MIIAIDPGAKGGYALFDKGKLIEVEKMPFYLEKKKSGKTSTYTNGITLAKMLSEYKDQLTLAVLEKVGSRPGQSSIAGFTFGKNVGIVVGILNAYGIPIKEVNPKEWQTLAGYNNIVKTKDPKVKSRMICERLWGKDKFMIDGKSWLSFDGLTDAALIGLYGSKRLRS